MSSTRSLFSDKARCFSQSDRVLYGNFIIRDYTKHPRHQNVSFGAKISDNDVCHQSLAELSCIICSYAARPV